MGRIERIQGLWLTFPFGQYVDQLSGSQVSFNIEPGQESDAQPLQSRLPDRKRIIRPVSCTNGN